MLFRSITGQKRPFDYQFSDTLSQVRHGIKAFYRAKPGQTGPSEEHLDAFAEIYCRLKARGIQTFVFIAPLSERVLTAMREHERDYPHLFALRAALLARAAADAGEKAVWQERVDAGRRQQETLRTRYAEAKTAEAEARRAYLTAHSAAGASGEGRALDALSEELAHRQTALDAAARRADTAEKAAEKTGNLLAVLRRSGFAAGQKLADLTRTPCPP